jgi:DNA polymerase I
MNVCAVDTETALVEPGLQIPPMVCLSRKPSPDLRSTAPVLLAEAGCDYLEDLIANQVLVVGLNIAYDMLVCCAQRPSLIPKVLAHYDADLITDVSVRQKLIDIAGGVRTGKKYSLAALADRLLDLHVEKEDTWRLRYWELAHLPLSEWPSEAIDYAALDADVTYRLWELQEQELTEMNRVCVLSDQYRRSRGEFALKLISAWGLRTDAEGCRILRESTESKLDELRPALLKAGLLVPKYTGRKPHKTLVGYTKKIRVAQRRLFDAAANAALTPGADEPQDPWKNLKMGPKGIELQQLGEDWRRVELISTDKEACADCDDLLMHDYSEYSQLSSLLTGFLKDVEQGIDAPIHTRFEILLETGRTSSSDPNVQNVRRRKGVRECFVPREGWCYIGCDIDRAELHTLAQVCTNLFGRSGLADTLNAGIDPHTRFGARLAHCSMDDLIARIAAGDEAAEEWRRRAKAGNFGFPGGMGPAGMRRYAKGLGVILTLDESRELHQGWKDENPVVSGEYLGWIGRLCRQDGVCTIEHFDSGRWRGNVRFCAAANSFFQGMAADALIACLWAVAKKCLLPGTALYGCHMVNEVHDEILVEAPLDIAADAALELQSTMRDAYNTYTRDVPVSCTPVLMDRWSKSAKPIVEDGLLKVWRYTRPEVTA